MKGGIKQRRWPLEPLVKLTGWTLTDMRQHAPCGGDEWKLRQTEGVTERIADRLAVAAGYHPWEIWPDMGDAAIDATAIECPGCGESFVPHWPTQRYCRRQCSKNASERRKRAEDPTYVERRNEDRRRYYAESGDYERARQRRYDRQRRHEAA